MTEAEAKTKWCPFARAALFVRGDGEAAVSIVGQGSNRFSTDVPDINTRIAQVIAETGLTRCIASKCMAWRQHVGEGDGNGRCGMVP